MALKRVVHVFSSPPWPPLPFASFCLCLLLLIVLCILFSFCQPFAMLPLFPVPPQLLFLLSLDILLRARSPVLTLLLCCLLLINNRKRGMLPSVKLEIIMENQNNYTTTCGFVQTGAQQHKFGSEPTYEETLSSTSNAVPSSPSFISASSPASSSTSASLFFFCSRCVFSLLPLFLLSCSSSFFFHRTLSVVRTPSWNRLFFIWFHSCCWWGGSHKSSSSVWSSVSTLLWPPISISRLPWPLVESHSLLRISCSHSLPVSSKSCSWSYISEAPDFRNKHLCFPSLCTSLFVTEISSCSHITVSVSCHVVYLCRLVNCVILVSCVVTEKSSAGKMAGPPVTCPPVSA